MHGARTKYCINCGNIIDINANKCPYCHAWQDKDNISRNHLLNSYVSPEHKHEIEEKISNDNEIIEITNKPAKRKTENKPAKRKAENKPAKGKQTATISETQEIIYSDVLVIRRLLLLLIVSCGLYSIWWYYKNNTLLKDRLNKNISPILRTIGFILPVIRWFMFYILIHNYEKTLKEENIESYSSILNTLVYIFIPVIGPVWALCNIQESINNLWYKKQANLPIRRKLTNGEIVFLIIMLIIIIFFRGLIFLSILFIATLLI